MPLEWNDLLAKANGANILLWRTPCVTSIYKTESARLNTIYARYSDHIKIKYLGWDALLMPSGLLEARKNVSSIIMRLTQNAYPYDLAPGIMHYVLWCSTGPPKDLHESVCHHLRTIYQDISSIEYIAHVNYDHERSILDLWHCQVFIRCK